MRIKIHIELTEEDLPFADLLEVIIGDVQETFTDSDEVDDIQIVVEEHPPQTYFDGQHGCEEEIEEEPIQDVVDVQETVTETIVEEVEETPLEEVEPVRKDPSRCNQHDALRHYRREEERVDEGQGLDPLEDSLLTSSCQQFHPL